MEDLDNEVRRSSENTDFVIDNELNLELDLDENGDSSSKLYNPQVSDEIKPRKGQEFETIDDVLKFYNSYAKAAGFSVRSATEKKEPGSNEIRRKEFICWKEGRPKRIASVEMKRRRGSIGENCNAKIAVLKSNSSSKYIVTVFKEGHSHPLASPTKVHLLPSHRNVSDTAKSIKKQLSVVNIPQHQSKMLYEYFKLEQAKNPSFTFKIETNDQQKITRCFWTDASSRRAYKFYGDFVIFDSTYNTNRYGLIFAPIMGVNNHGQTIIFACGFLSHETVDDFVWLFKQFLETMPGDAPKMIITDQDPAMAKAFPLVLPNTFHRYCSWHILMKFSEKIDSVIYSIYKNEFSACIWKSETPKEFDLQWESLIKKSGLGGNKWLNDIYGIRSRWIPAYVNHVFSANMSSSQRAESSHAFFKRFVSENNSLVEFMIQFGRGLVHQRYEELMADHKDKIETPKIRINHNFLVQMVDIYTNEMYYKFEDELCESFNYGFELVKEDDNHRVYHIQKMFLVATSKTREIVYDKDLDYVSCACKKFDSAGIPCRHILAYLTRFNYFSKLPDKYILKRWTKSINLGTVVDRSGVSIVNDSSNLLIRNQFVQSSLDLIDKALLCEETRKMFTDGVRILNEQIDQFISTFGDIGKSSIGKSNPIVGDSSVHASCNVENSYSEPDSVRAKGCEKRLKGGKEKALTRAKNKKV